MAAWKAHKPLCDVIIGKVPAVEPTSQGTGISSTKKVAGDADLEGIKAKVRESAALSVHFRCSCCFENRQYSPCQVAEARAAGMSQEAIAEMAADLLGVGSAVKEVSVRTVVLRSWVTQFAFPRRSGRLRVAL